MAQISPLRIIILLLVGWVTTPIQAQNLIYRAPTSSTPGDFNSMFGVLSGINLNSTANRNTFVGFAAGQNTISGSFNVFVGTDAGQGSVGGNQNVFVGMGSGNRNEASSNTFVGYLAGTANTSGQKNVFVGAEAGLTNGTGINNVFFGFFTGRANTSGSLNTFLGTGAGRFNTTASQNTFIGQEAGYSNTVADNGLFAGFKAGYANTEGVNNTFLGSNAGTKNTTGSANLFIGNQAGYDNIEGANNVFVGVEAGRNNRTGSRNTQLGNRTSSGLNATNDNVYLGFDAGQNNGGSQNTFLGTQAGLLPTVNPLPAYTNATAIGYNARVAASNAIVLGDTTLSTKVGIGLTAPQFALDVRGTINIRNAGKLRFAGLTNRPLTNGETNQFLTVNEQGEVQLARFRLTIDHPGQWADHVLSPGYTLLNLTEIEAFIQQKGHLPGIPDAQTMTKEGVDLVQMNALFLAKIEELTLHLIQLEKEVKQLKASGLRTR